jgi:peptidoglycan/xylan/chitin deacetylase (PgdA/CDA1 family)
VDVESRRARREQQQLEVRRRRRRAGLALASLGAVVIAVVVIVVTSTAGTSRPARVRHAARPARSRTGGHAQQPAGVRVGPPGTEAVPILMYHVIAPPPSGAPFPGLYVTPAEFAEQMQALRRAGWHAVTLDQLESNWLRGVQLPAGKPIVLTFDNGYQSQYTQALPVLRRIGWVADENIQLTGLPPSQGGIGEDEVKRLLAAGWELDTQGISHADLIALDPQQLHEQVAVARQTLQQRYHVPVNWFCYPSGHYDATVISAVKAAGYVGSTTVVPGWAHPSDDPYRLHRLRVLGGTSGSQLLSLIADTRADGAAPASYSGG